MKKNKARTRTDSLIGVPLMRKATSMVEVLVVMAAIAALVGILVVAIQKVREAAGVSRSLNNQRQVGLGFHHLASLHDGRLPALFYGTSFRCYEDIPLVAILPLIDPLAAARYKQADTSSAQSRVAVPLYISPLDPSMSAPNPALIKSEGRSYNPRKYSLSSYAQNAQFFFKYPTMSTAADGLANTIWLAEHYANDCGGVSFRYDIWGASGINRSWGSVQPATFAMENKMGRPSPEDYLPGTAGDVTFQVRPSVADCDPRQPNAPTARGLQVGLADGSARIIAPGVRPEVFWALVTPAGGEAPGVE